jgi:PAS domain S-box-containing protein
MNSSYFIVGIVASNSSKTIADFFAHLSIEIQKKASFIIYCSSNTANILYEELIQTIALPTHVLTEKFSYQAGNIYILIGEVDAPLQNIDNFFISLALEYGKDTIGISWGTSLEGKKGRNIIQKYGGHFWENYPCKELVQEFQQYLQGIYYLNLPHQLEKERNRLSYILEGTNVGTWEWNVQTGETIFNERWADILGYTLKELEPINIHTWIKYCHPDDLIVVNELIDKHFKGELAYYECEARMKHKNGHWVWVLDRGKVNEWDNEGSPLWMSGTHQDINERKITEISLKLSEERYRQVVETQSDFVLLSEPDTTITFANTPLSRALGMKTDDMLGLKWINFAKPEDLEPILEKIRNLSPTLPHFKTENRDKRANGSWGWTEWINQGIFDNQNRLVQIQSVGRDITEIKLEQEKVKVAQDELEHLNQILYQNQERLNKAQEIAKVGSWEFDLETFALVWSREHYRIFELSENIDKEKLYEAYRSKIHPADLPTLDKVIQEAQENGINFTYHHRVLCYDGSIKYVVGIGEVVRNGLGLPTLVRGTVQDITERIQAAEIVLKEQKRFQDIVNSTEGIVWEADYTTFCFTFVSEQATRLLGYELHEWYEPNFWASHIYPEDQIWAVNYCMTKSNNLEPHDFEYRFIAKDGSIVWLRDIVNVISENGLPTLLRGIMIDITAQKNAEKTLKEAYERLSQLELFVNHSTDAIQVADETGQLVYINQISTKHLGIPQEDTHLYNVKDFEEKLEDIGGWEKHLQDLKQQEVIVLEGLNKNLKTGETFPVEVKVRYIMMYGKGYIIASVRDITERKKMEEELQRLSLVAKRTSNVVVITNKKREIIWVNNAFEQITGYTLSEVKYKSPAMFQFEDTNQDTIQQIREKLNKVEAIRFEILNKGKQGNVYWLDVEIQPLFDEKKQLTGFMAVENDITTRKQYEQEIEEQNKVLREIAFIQSHILRRPIANILGLCSLIEMARDENQDDAIMQQYIDLILLSAQETDTVIHNIVGKINEMEDEAVRKVPT